MDRCQQRYRFSNFGGRTKEQEGLESEFWLASQAGIETRVIKKLVTFIYAASAVMAEMFLLARIIY